MTTSMFATIKDALNKPTQTNNTTSNIMRLKTGNTYTVKSHNKKIPFKKGFFLPNFQSLQSEHASY